MADQIRNTLDRIGATYLVPGVTNQIFPILSDAFLEELGKKFVFTEMERVDDTHRAIRFCTSWASTQENVDALCEELNRISGMFTGC
jgi:threonine aldolase